MGLRSPRPASTGLERLTHDHSQHRSNGDTFEFAAILGRPGVVESVCAGTGQPIRIELNPDRVISVDPPGLDQWRRMNETRRSRSPVMINIVDPGEFSSCTAGSAVAFRT
nr:organomercurial lyase [Microlunatus speluncae]